jgi:hypothetical protein
MPTDFLPLSLRQRAIALAVNLTANTPLAPARYERTLLGRYEREEISLAELEALLEASIYQVLYHSYATDLPSEAQLRQLLEQCRTYNVQHHITGLLLYSEGRYVQVLEGPREVVLELLAHIERDPRNNHLTTVHSGVAERRFSDWSMHLGYFEFGQLDRALRAVQDPHSFPPAIDDPQLLALVQAFGQAH